MYIIKILEKGEWWVLRSIETDGIVIDPDMREAKRFATKTDAQVASAYFPPDTTYRIIRISK